MEINRIFLIGYMGSGKSTIGKMLAAQLGFKFIDLDNYIEMTYGKKISQIFIECGEKGFRSIEREALHSVANMIFVVIATGGGTPCFDDNMEYINKSGISIYIKLPVEYLLKRLCKAKSKRPLIANKTDDELFDFINDALSIREIYYNRAMFISYNTTQTPMQTCNDILNFI